MDEKDIIEVIKNNPELIKNILYNAPTKSSNNKKLNDYLANQLTNVFPDETIYYINHLRANITSVMRRTLGVRHSKEVPDEKYTRAKSFYDSMIELIIDYKE